VAERVLVIEDDGSIRESLVDFFRGRDWLVTACADRQAADAALAAQRFHMVLLDLRLPDGDGLDVLRVLRKRGDKTPVIVLTARGEVAQRVLGLQLGADDYVVKPFSTRELVLRMRAVLRRTEGDTPGISAPERRVRFGECEVDFAAYTVARGSERHGLSRRELELLRVFLENPGRVLSREKLLDTAWGRDDFPTTRTVDMHVLKLRKKIERDPESPLHIVTVHGVGYRFER
jgi:two-component system alkaline phosphatase synthesis response regulator PhoP